MNIVQRISLVKKPVAITIIALICLYLVISASPTIFAKQPKDKAIKIGVLLPPDFFGREAVRSAVEFAVQEVNELLAFEQTYLELHFREPAFPPPGQALIELIDLYTQEEIQFVIGPFFSAQVQAIMEYAKANGILVVSPSSTSSHLALPDDNIFRFCPQEPGQGSALARLLKDQAITQVFAVYRNDDLGNTLLNIYEDVYTQYTGLEFAYEMPYEPYPPYDPDPMPQWIFDMWEAVAGEIDSAVGNGMANGVLFIGYDHEARDLFREGNDQEKYPAGYIRSISWFGTDLTALSPTLVMDLDAGGFASTVGFTATTFTPTRTYRYDRVNEALGGEPFAYAYVSYDIVWSLAYSISLVGYDSEAVKAALPRATESLSGASGVIVLNEAGDRDFGDFDLWRTEHVDDGPPPVYEWVHVGVYRGYFDSIKWFP